MKHKSLELIFTHLAYLEEDLNLFLLPSLLKNLTQASPFPCLSITLQPIPLYYTHTHTLCLSLFLRPLMASLYLNLMDKMDAYEVSSYLTTQQHLTELVTLPSFGLPALGFQQATLEFSPLVAPSLSLLLSPIWPPLFNKGIPEAQVFFFTFFFLFYF